MRNTSIKILILVILVVSATAGVLLFLPTIVAPPDSVPTSNLHKMTLETDVNAFNRMKNVDFNDSIYNVATNKMELYKSEKFMTEEEVDYQTKSLVQNYLPIFIKNSNDKFKASVWKKADHKAMLDRIKQLRSLKVDYGETNAVAGSFSDSLNKIENTIQLYNKACDAAKYKVFYSANDASAKIKTAEHYKTLTPLNNCKELVYNLSVVKVNIGKSHYNKVASKIEELANYRDMPRNSYEQLVGVVSDMIDEYNSICSMYGSYESTDAINKKATEYYKDAIEYYTIPEININAKEWVYMTSPNHSYRAYQSTNYYCSNSTSTMSFTIKGYETFTFYIRSDGEANYDYVIVGVDKVPTISDNYVSTKGNPKSGSAFHNYQAVRLNNLTRDKTYTIYVAYRKDGSDNNGSDRGFVLIPYENNK